MKSLLLFVLILLTQTYYAQTTESKYENLPFNGERGYKFGLSYDLHSKFIRAEAGIAKFNSIFGSTGGEMALYANHNIFLATEMNLNREVIFGPKLGYELNFIFVTARLNLVDYFDLKGNNNICARPELGLTLFGACTLSYGYNFNLTKQQDLLPSLQPIFIGLHNEKTKLHFTIIPIYCKRLCC